MIMSNLKQELVKMSNKEFIRFYMEVVDSLFVRERSMIIKFRGLDSRHQKPDFYRTMIGIKFQFHEIYNWTDKHNPPEWGYTSFNPAHFRQGYVYTILTKAFDKDNEEVELVDMEHYLHMRELHGWDWLPKRHYMSMKEDNASTV